MFGLAQTSHFGLWDIIPSPPPEFQLAFHIYYVKYENTLTCKRISWNSGGKCFKNIFLFPICIIQKVTILAPKLSRSFMEIGNQIQNHKKETNSELIYEDGSIWSTLIFIKIIGRDTLWFPLPSSEVLRILGKFGSTFANSIKPDESLWAVSSGFSLFA